MKKDDRPIVAALDVNKGDLLPLTTLIVFNTETKAQYVNDKDKMLQKVILPYKRQGIIIGAVHRCEGIYHKGGPCGSFDEAYYESPSFSVTKRVLLYQVRTGLKSRIYEVHPEDIQII